MPKSRRRALRHGYIIIDKPAGCSSHDVVTSVRRIVGERRVGHGGTLDPAAVGVLPVAVGLATRTLEYLSASDKAYRAEITFGIETDSSDGDGVVIARNVVPALSEGELEKIVTKFLGVTLQRPPMRSAIKVGGQRLYELARQGIDIDVDERPVTFYRLDVVRWVSPVLTLDVECSKGTYIRALAHDLGEVAGAGAYLSHLVRTRSGPFSLADALTLDELPELLGERGWGYVAFHPDWPLLELPAAVIGSDVVTRWQNGLDVPINVCETGTIRVYSEKGTWLGIGDSKPESGSIKPRKVIPLELRDA